MRVRNGFLLALGLVFLIVGLLGFLGAVDPNFALLTGHG